MEEELASRHHPPFPLRFSLASTDCDDEDDVNNDYGDLHPRPIDLSVIIIIVIVLGNDGQ